MSAASLAKKTAKLMGKIKPAAYASMLRSLAQHFVQIHLVTTDLFHTDIQMDIDFLEKTDNTLQSRLHVRVVFFYA